MPDSQSEVTAFLKSPDAFAGTSPVSLVETHGALVFLSDNEALKIKRAVTYDYMDMSTLALREKMIRRELELNKDVAPTIYRDVVPVTREADGTLALNGRGAPVEWVLRMWRFPTEAELAVIAEKGGFSDALATDLGAAVFEFHARAAERSADGAQLIGDILAELNRVFATMHDALGQARISEFETRSQTLLASLAPMLTGRGIEGHVRRCHGDLHLGNLVLIENRPVPFDALEFDEVLGTCDVLYDLAYLIMDLRHRGLLREAGIVLNTYLLAAVGTQDRGLAAMPLFLAIRAAIRAMVIVQTCRVKSARTDKDAGRYMDEALAALAPPPARMVAVGGLSGTGKTTVSLALAPLIGAAPGAVHLRSDLERKAMQGVTVQTRLPAEEYKASARHAVYDRMLDRAETILGTGHSVLLDATFLEMPSRERVEKLARTLGVPFTGLWLHAPVPDLFKRVTARLGEASDASDADEAVVRGQVLQGPGKLDWRRVDASGALPDTIAIARAALDQRT